MLDFDQRCSVVCGQAASVMTKQIAAGSIDLVYMDPPFFTQRDWSAAAGSFSDRWTFDDEAAARRDHAPQLVRNVLASVTGDRGDLLAYTLAMHEIVARSWECLSDTGVLLLHCDDTARAYLRIVLDLVFAPHRFWGELIWARGNHNIRSRSFARSHDTIIGFVKTGAALAKAGEIGSFLRAGHCEIDAVNGQRIGGILTDRLNQSSKERVGYPTQKPVSLLKQLVDATTIPGDTVLDPCCGSGTTLVAATALGRSAIGIDQSPDAVSCALSRLGLGGFGRGPDG